MIAPRRTVADTVSFEGLGLHGGVPVNVKVHPGEDGIAFRLGSERTPARPDHVTDTSRCTRLGSISTIEHLMSALCGLEITDAEIELDGPELPALDGSAQPYVEAIQRGGMTVIGERDFSQPFSRVFFQELPVKIAVGKGEGQWRYTYEADGHWPGEQTYETAEVISQYASEIAPARTFARADEVPAVLQAGLAKGLDIEKALIIGIDGYKNVPRFRDEPARHKLLDLMGDLYLAGIPARLLNVTAERSGHRTNVETAWRLYQSVHHESS